MRLWLTIIIFLACSCSVVEKNLAGQYNAKSFHRSAIILDSNHQFIFFNDGFGLAVTGERRFWTKGNWTRNQRIQVLNSIADSIATPQFDMIKQARDFSGQSEFVFRDVNKDTILIYTVHKNHKINFYRSHGPYLTSFKDSLSKGDTLFFSFTWGFNPVQILIDTEQPTKYLITLNREFRANYFRDSEFIIRRKKLIRATDKAKFKKQHML